MRLIVNQSGERYAGIVALVLETTAPVFSYHAKAQLQHPAHASYSTIGLWLGMLERGLAALGFELRRAEVDG